jgi:Ca2+:H+ antiporter
MLWAALALAFIALAAGWLRFPDFLVFVLCAAAILPLSALIGRATEDLADHLGPRFGGLLNATFGNAAELIITLFALKAGLVTLVKASITGSIIGNALLVLGLAAVVGGWRHGVQIFDAREAGRHSTMMILAVIGLYLPAGFATIMRDAVIVEELSVFVAVVLLLTYAAYVAYGIFMPVGGPRLVVAEPSYPGATLPAAMASPRATASAPRAANSGSKPAPAGHRTPWSVRTAGVILFGATLLTALVSELLVRTIEPVTHALGWTELFVGVILVPLVGNVAEHFSAVVVAWKNQMDLSLAIAAGSSTQLALFVAPLLVLASLVLGHPMDLVFVPMELLVLGLATAIFAFISHDGETTWLEGVQLLAVYLMAGVVFFLLPAPS